MAEKNQMTEDREQKTKRLRPEKQQRFFKARIIKFNRKLTRLGEKAVSPKNFSNLMIEGKALLTFASISFLKEAENSSRIRRAESTDLW